MYELDEVKVGMNPTKWGTRDKATKPANLTYPTNLGGLHGRRCVAWVVWG